MIIWNNRINIKEIKRIKEIFLSVYLEPMSLSLKENFYIKLKRQFIYMGLEDLNFSLELDYINNQIEIKGYTIKDDLILKGIFELIKETEL